MHEKNYSHHPAHEFALQNEFKLQDAKRIAEVKERLGAGRGLKHRAHCDNCKNVLTF
jgi:hypothetical protein